MSKAADKFFSNEYTGLVLAASVAVVVLYLIIKNAASGLTHAANDAIDAAATAVGDTVDSATTSIANAYTSVTLPSNVVPTGAIVFPDGSTATVAQVSAANSGLQSPVFYWNGLQYQLTGNFDASGNRIAQAGPDANTSIGSTWG